MPDGNSRDRGAPPIGVTRVYLGHSLSLATLAPVIEQLREALHESGGMVEIDSRDVVTMTEGASLLIASEMDRAQRAGVRFQMAA